MCGEEESLTEMEITSIQVLTAMARRASLKKGLGTQYVALEKQLEEDLIRPSYVTAETIAERLAGQDLVINPITRTAHLNSGLTWGDVMVEFFDVWDNIGASLSADSPKAAIWEEIAVILSSSLVPAEC